MKQHPIPQQIASYQFHLVGEMSLKQFLELIAGLIIGFIIYSLNFPSLIKFLLIFLSVFLGFALAFLPIQDRPLDKWIISFFKAIYSPAQFIWRKKTYTQKTLQLKDQIIIKKDTSFLINNQTTNKKKLKQYLETLPEKNFHQELDKQELSHLQQISQLLNPLGKQIENIQINTTTGLQNNQSQPKIEPAPRLHPPLLVESTIPQKLSPSVAAQFSTTLPFPSMPETANLIVGMVLTNLNKIIPGALIEIINKKGETVRALKSNKLGQFFSASPLSKGEYHIKIEHPNFKFDTINIKLKNKIVSPLKIKAKKQINF